MRSMSFPRSRKTPVLFCKRGDHFVDAANFHLDATRPNGLARYCRDCVAAYQVEWRKQNAKQISARRRARHTERMKTDPEYAERIRRQAREKKARHREKVNAKNREYAARKYAERKDDPEAWAAMLAEKREYTARIKRDDPERYAAILEARRINRRLRRMDAGLPIRAGKAKGTSKTAVLPAAPLKPFVALWVRAHDDDDTGGQRRLAQASGVSERRIYAILNDEQSNIAVETADSLCIAIGESLYTIYDDNEEGIAA